MSEQDTSVLNTVGNTIFRGSREQCWAYVKHSCPDGTYVTMGLGINMEYYQVKGIMYPALRPDRRVRSCRFATKLRPLRSTAVPSFGVPIRSENHMMRVL